MTEFLSKRETKFEKKVKDAINGRDDYLRSGRDNADGRESFQISFSNSSQH
jgi:hypothetical protein